MLQQRGLARILSKTSPGEAISLSDADHSSKEEVRDLSPDQTWRLIETSAASGDRIVVSISGDLKRERIEGQRSHCMNPPKIHSENVPVLSTSSTPNSPLSRQISQSPDPELPLEILPSSVLPSSTLLSLEDIHRNVSLDTTSW